MSETPLRVSARNLVLFILFLAALPLPAYSQPDIAVSPTSLLFGEVAVNDDSTLSMLVSNTGTANLIISALDIIGGDAGSFQIRNAPTLPLTITPGGSPQTLSVAFHPLSAGAKSAFFIIVSNDTDENPFTVPLSGSGVFPDINPGATQLDFGEVIAGQDSTQVLSIGNTGSGALVISSIQVVGSNSSEFSVQSPPLPVRVPAGGNPAQLLVRFAPLSRGTKTAFLSLVSNDPDENPLFIPLTGLATEPDIASGSSELDFAEVSVGSDSLLSVLLRNDGDAPLVISALQINGGNSTQFALSNPPLLPLTIAPGGNPLSLALRFAPTSAGLKTSALQIGSNDPDENPFSIVLTGVGIAPDIASDANPLNFGSVSLGDSLTIFFQLLNSGRAPLVISDSQFVDASGQFEVLSFPALPVTVAPNGGRVSLSVKFRPQMLAAQTALLQVFSNDPDENPFLQEFIGVGVRPEIALSRDTLDFGNVLVKGDSLIILMISNTGGAPLIIGDTLIAGLDADLFSIVEIPALPITILPGGNPVSLAIRYAPGELGASSAELTLQSNDQTNPQTRIPLLGSGAEPDIQAVTDSLLFGDVIVDSTGVLALILRNSGGLPLRIDSLRISAADDSLFTLPADSLLPQRIAPGDSLAFNLMFMPDSEQVVQRTLSVYSDDPDEIPLLLTVSGRGVLPRIALSGVSLDYSVVAVGGDSIIAVAIANVGSAPLTIRSVSLAGINDAEFHLPGLPATPFVIPPDTTPFALQVSFAPVLQAGFRQAMVIIESNDRDNILSNIVLQGRARFAPQIQNLQISPELNQDALLTIDVTADTLLGTVRAFYANANSNGFSGGGVADLSDVGAGRFSGVIPGSAVTLNGLKIRVVATDLYPLATGKTSQVPVRIRAGDLTLGSASSVTSTVNRWQMFSLPYDAINDGNKSIPAVLASLGEEGDFTWRIYRTDPGGVNAQYLASSELLGLGAYGRFEPGNAFWLYLRDDAAGSIPTTTLSFPELQTVAADSFGYTLQPGWNQIGNPYSFTLSWDQVTSPAKESLQIYRWSGTAWQDSLAKSGWTPLLGAPIQLEPWSGYAVLNNSTVPVDIVFHVNPVAAAAQRKAGADPLDGLRIVLIAGNASSFDVAIAGTAHEALDERDRLDYPDPVAPASDAVNIRFHRPQWGGEELFFASDIRSVGGPAQIWPLDVTSAGHSAELRVAELSGLAGGEEAGLFDRKFGKYYALQQQSTLTVAALDSRDSSRFLLLAGPAAQLPALLEGVELLLPDGPGLSQNYPNPFNPSTVIPWHLAQAGEVRLEIYDLLGRRIRTLVNGLLSAGYYEMVWDGRSDAGKEVASGVYIYRLIAAERQTARKLIKLK